jgi:hypothetical protein
MFGAHCVRREKKLERLGDAWSVPRGLHDAEIDQRDATSRRVCRVT